MGMLKLTSCNLCLKVCLWDSQSLGLLHCSTHLGYFIGELGREGRTLVLDGFPNCVWMDCGWESYNIILHIAMWVGGHESRQSLP